MKLKSSSSPKLTITRTRSLMWLLHVIFPLKTVTVEISNGPVMDESPGSGGNMEQVYPYYNSFLHLDHPFHFHTYQHRLVDHRIGHTLCPSHNHFVGNDLTHCHIDHLQIDLHCLDTCTIFI